MYITRQIQGKIEEKLFKGQVVILYGARQVGKTTLLKEFERKYAGDVIYLNCDEPDIREKLTDKTSTQLKDITNGKRLVLIDEAQRVRDIGISLKLLVDSFPGIQIIATGSSSFELSNAISEPLTGRKNEFLLHSISLLELEAVYSKIDIERMMEKFMIYGMYPKVALAPSEEAGNIIDSISTSYLYKDALEFQNIKKPEAIEKLLQALALQIGNEVSYKELATLLSMDKITVEKYVDILEKAFIIFKLPPLSRNLRKEIGKMRKIYFYDLGVRNSLIRNFNDLSLRNDNGAIWENFMIAEKMKNNDNLGKKVNAFFWRTYDQKEIDYIEESGGILDAYEFKWGAENKDKIPDEFIKSYSPKSYEVVGRGNYIDFLGK
jgi:predicted AAA+ superfamily ATPase